MTRRRRLSIAALLSLLALPACAGPDGLPPSGLGDLTGNAASAAVKKVQQ